MKELSLHDLHTVTGGFGMQDTGPSIVYRPGLGWQNTWTGRFVNVQNGGPPNQGSRRD
jgi:hypothetical protein